MIIKYISFLTGIIWSYSIIKTQSVFSKKVGIIFKVLITKVSWFYHIDQRVCRQYGEIEEKQK